MEVQNQVKTITNLPQNDESALCYIGGWLTGIIFLLLAKHNPITRFHALQSLMVFGFLLIIYVLLNLTPYVGWSLLPLWWLISFVLWLVLIVAAYQGHEITVPLTKRLMKTNDNMKPQTGGRLSRGNF